MAGLGSHFGGISRSLSNRDYRVYWYGQVMSVQGVWINRVASGLLIFELTNSYSWLGAIAFLHLIPMFLVGPLGGAVADRIGHRTAAMRALFVGIVLVAILTFLVFSDQITPLLLAILTGVMGFAVAFEFPARQAMIPHLVRREDLSAAIAMNSTTFNTAAFIGPAIGSALVTLGGPALAYFVQALTMAWMFVAIYSVSVRDTPKLGEPLSRLWTDIREGALYTFRDLNLRWIIIATITVSALIRTYTDLMPGFAVNVYAGGNQDEGETINGFLLSASGGGALVMSIVMALRGRTEHLTRIMIFSAIGAATTLILFAATNTFWIGIVLMVFTGAFVVVAAISAQTLVQNVVANEYRARTISVYLALALGSVALGTWILGMIADLIGLQLTVGAAAAIGLVSMIAYARPIQARRAEMEREPEHPRR